MSAPATDEVDELRRCLRDLLGVLALPAVWRARSPREILRTLVDALDATLSTDAVVVFLKQEEGEPLIGCRIGADPYREARDAPDWFDALALTSSWWTSILPSSAS
ncbi:MAG TPA: hypothetical protein VHC69_31275 [Polyangiaceae bacterium]|nr:hypothetical protein [Polyangiaceae bacterium]